MASTKMSWFDFPGEIRNQIYDLLLISSMPIEICVCKGDLRRTRPIHPGNRHYAGSKDYYADSEDDEEDCQHQPPGHGAGPSTAILATCRAIYNEACPILYADNTFMIHAKKKAALSTFLDRIGNHNATCIRQLHIPFPSAKIRRQFEVVSDEEKAALVRRGGHSFGALPKEAFSESWKAATVTNTVDNDKSKGKRKGKDMLRLTNPIMLDLIRERCTSLETLETMVGTVHLNYMVRTRGLEAAAMALVDDEFRKVPQVKKVVINMYYHFDAVGKWWAVNAVKLGWEVVVHKRAAKWVFDPERVS